MGNKNAWKHGGRSKMVIDNRRHLNNVMREMRQIIKQMEADQKRNERAD